jgi:hypothetical protein
MVAGAIEFDRHPNRGAAGADGVHTIEVVAGSVKAKAA